MRDLSRTGGVQERRVGRRRRLLGVTLLVVVTMVALAVAAIMAGIATGVIVLPHQAATGATAALVGAADQATPAATTPAASGSPTSDGPAAAAAPAVVAPQLAVVSQHDYADWLYLCVRPESDAAAAATCSIVQRLVAGKSGAAIFLWRITADGKGGLVSLWQTPQAVTLSRGVTIDAGTPKPIVLPYDSCGGDHCNAVANLGDDFVETLAKAPKIAVGLVLGDGRDISFEVSTNGLADALTALRTPPKAE
jgi:invasion protein IalB